VNILNDKCCYVKCVTESERNFILTIKIMGVFFLLERKKECLTN
jgi:hypothetical protein